MKNIISLLILTLIFSACSPVVHTPPDDGIRIADGRIAYVGVGPNGLPGKDVALFVDAPIVDKATGKPVQANVYFIESPTIREPAPEDMIHENTTQIVLAISDPDEVMLEHRRGTWLVVEAPGYERWEVDLVYRITERRTYANPIQLALKTQKT